MCSKPRTTIALSELEGLKISPELRFQNIITTDFVADDTILSGAPLLTKDGDVSGMIIRLGSAQLIAIPVAEIREVLKQLTATDSAVTVPPMEFDTLEDFLKPGRELFDKEMKQIDERLAKVVEGSAEHLLLTTKKKQLQQQWDLSVAQVKGMAAAAKAGKPVQLAPIVIPNNSRPWQAPMPDPLLGHEENIAKVLAGTWQVKRYVGDADVLDAMPLDQRQVLEWKNFDRCSVCEIAERMGRNEKSVEAILYRARITFREQYKIAVE